MAPTAPGAATRLPTSSRIAQLLGRVHSLGSLFWIPLTLTLVAFNPLDDDLQSFYLPLAVLPYAVAQALDLRLAERPAWDILPVHLLVIAQVPVNLAGALASVRQIVTGPKVPFVRTPKVEGRTVVPAGTVLIIWSASALFAISFLWPIWIGDHHDAVTTGLSARLVAASAWIFLGIRERREDIAVWIRSRRAVFCRTADSPSARSA